jgi:hypothetical protein
MQGWPNQVLVTRWGATVFLVHVATLIYIILLHLGTVPWMLWTTAAVLG